MIQATIAKLHEKKILHEELKQKKTKIDESEFINHAKSILMRQRNLDEDQAFVMLSTMANKRKMKLVDLSVNLIETSKLLII